MKHKREATVGDATLNGNILTSSAAARPTVNCSNDANLFDITVREKILKDVFFATHQNFTEIRDNSLEVICSVMMQ